MPSWPVLISQAFNGLALGTLLALVSSGLTIILGTLGVLNFAHGALFAVGAYAAFVLLQYTSSFVLAIVGRLRIHAGARLPARTYHHPLFLRPSP
jgi:branched-chain amino acid transport system permease protein